MGYKLLLLGDLSLLILQARVCGGDSGLEALEPLKSFQQKQPENS